MASLLTKEIKPTFGTVSSDVAVHFFKQNNSTLFNEDEKISTFLGIDKQIKALNRIEQGSCEESDFELLADNWKVKEDAIKILEGLRLPLNFELACASLSGGERTKLSLWKLFQSDAQLLILDEPSNHLDTHGKQWLEKQIKNFTGDVLVITHDLELLHDVDAIYELSSLGLSFFQGAYSEYIAEKKANEIARERKLSNLTKQKKNVLNQAHKSKEKAQKRASKGIKLMKNGSQAKVLLDGKKNRAETAMSSRVAQTRAMVLSINSKQDALLKGKEKVNSLSLLMNHERSKRVQQLYIENIELPFGSKIKLNLQVKSNDKIHLVGENGSGKSTLMKVILGELKPTNGIINSRAKIFYCDQHFSLLGTQLTMLECMEKNCIDLNETNLRTILAAAGFRGDKVYTHVNQLSGGEKMKLMILIASHQSELPLLLLDEPDNHLDIESKTVLANALNEFNGSFILISHDQYLMSHIEHLSKVHLD